MKRLAIQIAIVLTVCGQVLADQITLKNGDRVSGKIMRSDGGKLVVKSELLGEVIADLSSVVNITTDQVLYVTLPDGRTVYGMLTASENTAELRAANSKVISIERADIRLIRSEEEHLAYQRSLNPGWLEGWSGGADIGLALTSRKLRHHKPGHWPGFDTRHHPRQDECLCCVCLQSRQHER